MKIRWIIRGDSRGDIDRRGRGGPRSWWQIPSRLDSFAARRYLTQVPTEAQVYNTEAEAEAEAVQITQGWASVGISVVTQVKPRRLP